MKIHLAAPWMWCTSNTTEWDSPAEWLPGCYCLASAGSLSTLQPIPPHQLEVFPHNLPTLTRSIWGHSHITAYSMSTIWYKIILSRSHSQLWASGPREILLSVSDAVGSKGHPIKLPCGKFKITKFYFNHTLLKCTTCYTRRPQKEKLKKLLFTFTCRKLIRSRVVNVALALLHSFIAHSYFYFILLKKIF